MRCPACTSEIAVEGDSCPSCGAELDRDHNADAFRSAAGQWLAQHAPQLGFDTYNTKKEIWHMEWRKWRGTSADPSARAPAGGGAQAPAPAAAELPDAVQDADSTGCRARGCRR